MGGCPASDAFAMGNLLSTTTFTGAGTSVTKLAGIPIDLSAPYVTTLVYTIVMPGDAYKDADASIDLSTSLLSPPGGSVVAPLPAALPLFATGLGALGCSAGAGSAALKRSPEENDQGNTRAAAWPLRGADQTLQHKSTRLPENSDFTQA